MTLPLILASASPRRKEILAGLNLDFSVRPVDTDESLDALEKRHPALYIAERKAQQAHRDFPGSWIIACDTVVEAQGLPAQPSLEDRNHSGASHTAVSSGPLYLGYLGKASDAAEARQMLEHLSGTEHFVRTGHVMVSPEGRFEWELTSTLVRFRELDENTLQWYISTGEWKDKAGAYAIQGYGCLLVEEIQGDYLNVVGLSPAALDRILWRSGRRLMDFAEP